MSGLLVGLPPGAVIDGFKVIKRYVPDKASGNLYLVLDYVDGWTLGEWMERKHPTVHEVLCVIVKIAAALAYIHSRGVLHRDLKWANVLIRKSDGEPIIIDLGCASHALAEDLTEEGLPPGRIARVRPDSSNSSASTGKSSGRGTPSRCQTRSSPTG